MITLIAGYPGSGKSELAEKLATTSGEGKRIYLATMIAYDEAGVARIEKHRKQREGKGFLTIEKAYALSEMVDEIEEGSTVLLECISNLVGNEMYENGQRYAHAKDPGVTGIDEEDLSEKIVSDIRLLGEKAKELIVVTNRFSESDCRECDPETAKYITCIRRVNEKLTELAGRLEWIE